MSLQPFPDRGGRGGGFAPEVYGFAELEILGVYRMLDDRNKDIVQRLHRQTSRSTMSVICVSTVRVSDVTSFDIRHTWCA